MCDTVVDSLYQMDYLGKVKHETFVQSKLVDISSSISKTIPNPNNLLPTFGYQQSSKEKSTGKLEVLERNTSLVSQLFLSVWSHPDFLDFFTFENYFEPLILANKCMAWKETKSDIFECLDDTKSVCKETKKTTIHILDNIWPL